MVTVIIKTLITFLAIYGFVHIIKDIVEIFSENSNNDELAIVIKVKNAQDSLESTVRMLILKSLSVYFGGFIPDIIIVDMGSDDDTAVIAKKLSCDYSFVYYTTIDLYEKAKMK